METTLQLFFVSPLLLFPPNQGNAGYNSHHPSPEWKSTLTNRYWPNVDHVIWRPVCIPLKSSLLSPLSEQLSDWWPIMWFAGLQTSIFQFSMSSHHVFSFRKLHWCAAHWCAAQPGPGFWLPRDRHAVTLTVSTFRPSWISRNTRRWI